MQQEGTDMKRIALAILIALLLVCGACAGEEAAQQTLPEPTTEAAAAAPTGAPTKTPAPTPTPTPPPDFSGTDLSGVWVVSAVIDSMGETVSETQLQALGADFSMELLAGGSYFVYDEVGAALGQGTYEVELNVLTLTAAGATTIYEIQDEGTLHCTNADQSITVMNKRVEAVDDENDDESAPADDEAAEDESTEDETADSETTSNV